MEVRKPIHLSFGVVSGIGGGMGALKEVNVPQGKAVSGILFPNDFAA